MFRESKKSTQVDAFSSVKSYLPESKIKDLEDVSSWHNMFNKEVYKRIDESIFACLYSKKTNGRPNASIKRLVSMMILKEGEGWTDRQLFENCRYNLKTMYAIGLYNLSETIPSESTYYEFKAKMVTYESEKERCLLSELFAQITKGQIDSYGFNCGRIRMDSKLIQSNIKRSSRLSLIVETIRSFCRKLTSSERELVKDKKTNNKIDLIIGQTATNYTYGLTAKRIKKDLIKLGKLLAKLVQVYADSKPHNYAVLYQVFTEQYELSASPAIVDIKSGKIVSKALDQTPVADQERENETRDNTNDSDPDNPDESSQAVVNKLAESNDEPSVTAPQIPIEKIEEVDVKGWFIVPKQNKDISADGTQSPYDPDAEYKKKQNQSISGFTANITEACDVLRDHDEGVSGLPPRKPLHIITDITLEGATYTDCKFWHPAIEATKKVTGQEVEFVNADGAYTSIKNQIMANSAAFQNTEVAFSKSKGHPLTFRFYHNAKGELMIKDLVSGKVHRPEFIKTRKGLPRWRIQIDRNSSDKKTYRYFTPDQVDAYLALNDKITINDRELVKQRANVESTIRQVSCKLDGGKKSRYRGKTKIKMAAIASGLWVNCTRIALACTKGLINSFHQLCYTIFHCFLGLCISLFWQNSTNSRLNLN